MITILMWSERLLEYGSVIVRRLQARLLLSLRLTCPPCFGMCASSGSPSPVAPWAPTCRTHTSGTCPDQRCLLWLLTGGEWRSVCVFVPSTRFREREGRGFADHALFCALPPPTYCELQESPWPKRRHRGRRAVPRAGWLRGRWLERDGAALPWSADGARLRQRNLGP